MRSSSESADVEIEISKVAESLSGELAGAKLKIEAVRGTFVREWESGEKPAVFKVKPGEYRFSEVRAPHGYEQVPAFTFTVADSGAITMTEHVEGVSIEDTKRIDPEVVKPQEYSGIFYGAQGPIHKDDSGDGIYKDLNGTDHFRLWVSRNKDFGQKELVYCFNLAKSYPPKWDSIRLNNAEYIRELGSPELFNTHANAIGQKLGAEKLTEHVLKVIHYGMRLEDGKNMDLAGIKKKNDLTNEEWYRATQEAIWVFTDKELSAVSKGSNTEKVFQAIKDLVEIAKKEDADVLPTELTLDLYTVKDKQSSNNYQNLLGTRFVPKERECPH